MGKASRGKRQKESQAESTSKDKSLEAGKTSAKKSLYRNSLFHVVLVIIIGLLAYSNTFHVPFVFDDLSNIRNNYNLRYLNNFWSPSESRWFGFLTFALNYYFGGLNTVGYHIVNLSIHILNAILVYWFVLLTFRTPYFKVSVISASVSNQPNQFNLSTFQPFNYLPLFIALLFVSHPIQTQAVTYIVQRFTSLATMFYLLSLVMYIKFRSQQSVISRQRSTPHPSLPLEGGGQGRGWRLHATRYTLYAVSLISAVLAMKTKEISFTLPFIITLYEFCFFKSENYELRTMKVRRLLYLMPFVLTLLIIPLSMIGIDKPIGDAIGELRETTQETEEIPRWGYLFTQLRVIATYIRLLFLPINQNLDYDYPVYDSFLNPNVFLSFLFLSLLFGIAIYLLYRSLSTRMRAEQALPLQNSTRYTLHPTRLIAFGIFWFFITLSVESSVIPIRDVIFEHRVYLPSVGAVMAFSTAVFYVLHRATEQQSNRAVVKGKTAVLLHYCSAALIVIILSIATYQRNIVWQDGVRLWEDVVEKSPQKARGYNSLGAYIYQGLKQVDKSIQLFQTALRLNPNHEKAHYNLGNVYYDKGMIDKAAEHYQTALRLNPNYAEAHNYMGMVYEKRGLLDEAIKEYQIALRLKPDYAKAHYNLGGAYWNKGLADKAIQAFQTALRLKLDYADAHYNLGLLYLEKGVMDKAQREFEMALQIKPDYYQAQRFLNYISNLNKIRSH